MDDKLLEKYNEKYAEYEKIRDQLWEIRDELLAQTKTAQVTKTIRIAQQTIKKLRKLI